MALLKERYERSESIYRLKNNNISLAIDNYSTKIINHPNRAKEGVILDNAPQTDLHSCDECILSAIRKLKMCMPAINNREIKDLFNFEDNFIEEVVNEEHTEVLKTIASQLERIAISLENSYLHNNLQKLGDERASELRGEIAIRKQAEKRLEHMANHDYLTDLPNRRRFHEILEHSIKMAEKNNYAIAVLFVDLDGFKKINDIHGHDKGDTVLKIAAKRLNNSVRSCDTVSRMGGDEFVLILENIKGIEDIQVIANRIIKSIGESILLDEIGTKAKVTASIGISILNSDGTTAEELITNADKAMYKSKESGKNQYVFYSNSLQIE